ncbi:hypothetical protein H5410_023043 [Solanum commersonii]|uniref:Uncharacterized protein n=1 Tax=Solanum commersonii TaxID=4109 RepID=A0A9J5ZGG5_SOLCO|nr:hypothetical protein H5410_023043 [Solanum commersonii]
MEKLHSLMSHQSQEDKVEVSKDTREVNFTEDKDEVNSDQNAIEVYKEAGLSPLVLSKCKKINLKRRLFNQHEYRPRGDNYSGPWLVGGDFNVILGEDEKIGGLPVYIQEYEDFAFCVNSCGLFDINFSGSPFTWWNGRVDEECIFKRLDRILINQELRDLFWQLGASTFSKDWI